MMTGGQSFFQMLQMLPMFIFSREKQLENDRE